MGNKIRRPKEIENNTFMLRLRNLARYPFVTDKWFQERVTMQEEKEDGS